MADNRKHIWQFLLYPDSMKTDAFSILESLQIPILISPLHDSDLLADGTPKKPHYHVMLDFGSNKKSWNQIHYIALLTGGVLAPIENEGTDSEKCDSYVDNKRGSARYYCHLDSPTKHLYDIKDVICFNGFDYNKIISTEEDKSKIYRDMTIYIYENQVEDYAEFAHYCALFNPAWDRALRKNAYHFKEIMYRIRVPASRR
jgi:Plasmid replication protein.